MLREHHHLSMCIQHHRTHIRCWYSIFPQTWWSPVADWMKVHFKNQLKFCSENQPTPKTVFAGNFRNVKYYTEMLCLPTIHPMGWGQFQNQIIFPRIKSNVLWAEKCHLPPLTFTQCRHGGRVNLQNICFARNLMKYLDWNRKFVIPPVLMGVQVEGPIKLFLPKIEWNVLIYTEKLCLLAHDPLGQRGAVNSRKSSFCQEMNDLPRYAQKIMYAKPLSSWDGGWVWRGSISIFF